MNPQEIESEIPRMWGHLLKQEEELSTDQKVVGAAAVANCVTVDAARNTVDDVKATIKDFEDGTFDDPSAEAVRILCMVSDVLEEIVIANSIQALRFMATSFGTYTLSKLLKFF